jgi:hypothetical protein
MLSELNRILDYDRTSDSDFINIYSPERGPDFFVLMEFDHSDGRLFIDESFLDKFSSMYPLDKEQSGKFISDWFSKAFDVDVMFFDY